MSRPSLLLVGFLFLFVAACHFCVPPVNAQTEKPAATDALPYPVTTSKKGLQVEHVDDAIALGIQHAAVNVDLNRLIDPQSSEGNPVWKIGQQSFSFNQQYLNQLDKQIQPLSAKGIVVNAILLAYLTGNAEHGSILIHPNCDPAAPNRLGAFNNRSEAGKLWLQATIEFLADRWSGKHPQHGRVCGWIVGNEVNSHWWWANCGPVTMQQFSEDYSQVVRIVHSAVRTASDSDRVYISLEHHWTIRFPAGSEKQSFPGRDFLLDFAKRIRETGDFDWHVAFHPYPENLFDPAFWLDETAVDRKDSPRVTFRNLSVLLSFLDREELQINGQRRRVILSEQGFHSDQTEAGLQLQAAAYCFAYQIVDSLSGIDAFILHRHIDHPQEGGLNLGLRQRLPPGESNEFEQQFPRKPIYKCFQAAGTADQASAFEFALPIIGLKNWDQGKQ